MEDQERTEEQGEDVEGHRKKATYAAGEEPTDELAESDDVEGHLKRGPKAR